MSEPSSGAHFYLSGTDAASWRSAAKFLSEKVCGSPIKESELDKKAELLKEQNAKHLKASGAYGRPALDAPKDADSRAFSRLRSGVRIYADVKEACHSEKAGPELIPLVPVVPKEEPKPEPELKLEPKPEPKKPAAPKPKPTPKPKPKPEERILP